MKLVWAIVPDAHAGKLVDALVQRNLRCTRFQSHGGFLRARNSTLLLGIDDNRLAEALGIIRAQSGSLNRPAQAPAGEPGDVAAGDATLFVLDVEHYERV